MNMVAKETKQKEIKTVSVDVPEWVWRKTRMIAVGRGVNAKDLVTEALISYLQLEESKDAQ